MRRIGIFGGTFDPPHTEHFHIAKAAIKDFSLDRLLIVPGGNPPHKDDTAVTDKRHRFEMAKLAFGGLVGAELDDYEMTLDGKSYTYLTLQHYKARFPDAELFLILGGDSLRDIPLWKNPELIRSMCRICCVTRPDVKTDYSGVLVSKYNGKRVSSADLRVKLEFGLETKEIFPDVRRYISENGLYKNYERYVSKIRELLKPTRYLHTAHVVMQALELAKANRLKVSEHDVFIAAALHDIAKYMTLEDAARMGFDASVAAGVPPQVLHSYMGEYVAKRLFPELNADILGAIRYHTTFCADMTDLQKIVALADSVEPTRAYPGVAEVRSTARNNLDAGCLMYLERTLRYLENKAERDIAPETREALAYFKTIVKGEKLEKNKG